MGSTRSHPLPPGMSSSSSEFDGWTTQELVSEINRLTELLKIRDESKRLREIRIDYETVVLSCDEEEEEDIKVQTIEQLRCHSC